MKIAAVGDIACQPPLPVGTRRVCRHVATGRLIRDSKPAALLTLGDQQYESGRLTHFRQVYDRSPYGSMKWKTNPVPGNHEYATGGAAGYYTYFRARDRGAPGYYYYTVGAWRVYALNSNCDTISCAAQVAWLRARLADDTARCTLVYMHHPRYSSGHHGNIRMVRTLWRPLLSAHADVIVQAHDHSYERFRRMGLSGPSRTGMRSFVSGLGGKSRYGFEQVQPGSQFRYANRRYGVLFLTLEDSGYAWRFRTVDGVTRDSGSDACVA